MKKYILCIMLTLVVTTMSYGKRLPPPVVKPFVHTGIKYSAPSELMGTICADDIKTNSILWWKQIYVVKYIPDLEKDVQSVFITDIKVEGNNLIISNERGFKYKLNLETLSVEILKGKKVVEFKN